MNGLAFGTIFVMGIAFFGAVALIVSIANSEINRRVENKTGKHDKEE